MDRTKYIGSSDARDILNGNWMPVWALKTGRARGITPTFKMELGTHIEPFHLDWIFSDEHKPAILADYEEAPQSRFQFNVVPDRSLDMPVGSSPDAQIIRNGDGWHIPVEVKHTCRWRSLGEAIDWYMPQLQHHIWVAGSDLLYFSVIIGNEDPVGAFIGRSDEWIALYASKVRAFIHHVVTDTPPPTDMVPSSPITPSLSDAIPVNGMIRKDLSASNSFVENVHDYLANEGPAKKFNKAKAAIKSHMTPEISEAYCTTRVNGGAEITFSAKRDAGGAIRISVKS